MIADNAALIAASIRLHHYTANERWKAAYDAAYAVDALLGVPRRPPSIVRLPTKI